MLIGWETHLQKDDSLNQWLEKIKQEYEVFIVNGSESAVSLIVSEYFVERSPILGLIFNRNFLVTRREVAKSIDFLAKKYKAVCSVNIVNSHEDTEAKSLAVSKYFVLYDDWEKTQEIIESNILKRAV